MLIAAQQKRKVPTYLPDIILIAITWLILFWWFKMGLKLYLPLSRVDLEIFCLKFCCKQNRIIKINHIFLTVSQRHGNIVKLL